VRGRGLRRLDRLCGRLLLRAGGLFERAFQVLEGLHRLGEAFLAQHEAMGGAGHGYGLAADTGIVLGQHHQIEFDGRRSQERLC
jgi:hypothetical protein